MKKIGIKLADGTFHSILEEGKPAKKEINLTTVKDNQTTVKVDLYRSETASMDDAEYVDTLKITHLKEQPNGQPTINLSLGLNQDNRLSAELVDMETGGEASTEVTLISTIMGEGKDPNKGLLNAAQEINSPEGVTIATNFEESAESDEPSIDEPLANEEPMPSIDEPVVSDEPSIEMPAMEDTLQESAIEEPLGEMPIDEPLANEEPMPSMDESAVAEDSALDSISLDTPEIEMPEMEMPPLDDTPISFDEPAQDKAIAFDEPAFTDEPPAIEESAAIEESPIEETPPTESEVPAMEETPFEDTPAESDAFDVPLDTPSFEETASFDDPFAGDDAPAAISDPQFDLPDFGDTPAFSDEPAAVSDDTITSEDTTMDTELPDLNLPDFGDTDFGESETSSEQEPLKFSGTDFDLPEFDSDPFAESGEDPFANYEAPSDTDTTRDTSFDVDPFADDDPFAQDEDVAEDSGKNSKVPMIICLVCAAICILAVLFLLLNAKNIFKKDKAEPTIIAQSPLPVETKTEIPTIEPLPKTEPPAPVAKEDEIVVITEAEKVVPELPPEEPKTEKTKEISYKIKWGDTLWDLAATYYKNPWMYPKIAKYNNIKNPDYIIAGTYINIPEE